MEGYEDEDHVSFFGGLRGREGKEERKEVGSSPRFVFVVPSISIAVGIAILL